MLRTTALAVAACAALPALAQPLTSAFTYQGRLDTGGAPAAGPHDLRFALFSDPLAGLQVGPTLCADNLTLQPDGSFTASLDFGAVFAGQRLYLQIQVRPDAGAGCLDLSGFTTLLPRQELSAAPYALHALSASNATQFNGQPASFYTSASNLSAGTLPDARLSSNVANLTAAQTFSGVKTFAATPAFNGGTSGSSPPFTVDSTFKVSGLNADLLDGLDSSFFSPVGHAHAPADIAGPIPVSNGGTGATTGATARQNLSVPGLGDANSFLGTNSFSAATAFFNWVSVSTSSPTAIPFSVHAPSGATADLQQWLINSSPIARITPAGGLTLNGPVSSGNAVTATNFVLSPAVTRYRHLYHPAFTPGSSSTTYSGLSHIEAAGAGTVYFQAPLELPDGAVITEVRFRLYDNDAARDVSCSIIYYGGGFSPSSVVGGSGVSAGAVATFRDVTLTPTYTHSAANYTLALRVSWDAAAGTNIRLFSARIAYTTTSPLP